MQSYGNEWDKIGQVPLCEQSFGYSLGKKGWFAHVQNSKILIPFCLEVKLHEYLFYCPKTR